MGSPNSPTSSNNSRGDRPYGNRTGYPNRSEGGDSRGDLTYGNRSGYPSRSEGRDTRGDRPYGNRSGYSKRSEGGDSRGERPYGNRSGYPNRSEGGDTRGDRPYGNRSGYPNRSEGGDSRGERIDGNRIEPFKGGSGLADRGKKTFNRSWAGRRAVKAVPSSSEGIRLNRYIALSGLCSRRKADEWIEQGRVKVNERTVKVVGTKVNEMIDRVEVNGEVIRPERPVYILMNKPKNHLTTVDDPEGRPTVMDLLHGLRAKRVYPVGRLDRNTTGVLLLTNDGDLAKRLMHPSYQIPKVYRVRLDQPFREDHLKAMKSGIELEDGPIRADRIGFSDRSDVPNEVLIELHSGRNRIVRRMFEHFGYTITSLDRMIYGTLTKKGLERGAWRYLNDQEVGFLKMSADPEKRKSKPAHLTKGLGTEFNPNPKDLPS
jgi:23S rRNA pseudouridine2605 synthase